MNLYFKVLVICGAILLYACGGSGGSSSSDTTSSIGNSSFPGSSSSASSSVPYQYFGRTLTNLSVSTRINSVPITYKYHVYLPYNYDNSEKSYPIVYGTDAQWIFTHFSQTLDVKNKDVIFVGIEVGVVTGGILDFNRRFVDFGWLGASGYIKFFKTEFVPMIESSYRTNKERTYVGTSLGGLLGSILLAQEPIGEPYFKNYMLFDGSFFAQTDDDLKEEQLRFEKSKILNVNLILTSASIGNVDSVNVYQARYQARAYEGLIIHRRSYDLQHDDVANPSFDETIDLLY